MAPVRILFVEDDTMVTGLYRLLLRPLGEFVIADEDKGERALETARAFQPDMIFLDCDLPGKSGRQIAAELKADAGLKDVPIAYLTGGITREEAASATGGVPSLAKPFRPEEFIRMVCAHVPWWRPAMAEERV